MFARVLKEWMPRSLYGRSALIVLVPVMVILLIVTIEFIQRLYEGVTDQMTTGIAHEVQLILNRIEAAPDAATALEAALEVAAPLGIEITSDDGGFDTRRATIDLSGKTVIAVIEREIDGVRAVD